MGVERHRNTEIDVIREENPTEDIWTHARKPDMEDKDK
jgi:hypothetical protein